MSHERGVAYVLKGFGRTSETFITNEIRLLEQLGMRPRIFSIKKLEGQQRHAAMEEIRGQVTYLPQAEDLGNESFLAWFRRNGPVFAPAHRKAFMARPGRYLGALLEALAMCVRFRESWKSGLKAVYLKEFLQAGAIAAELADAPEVKLLHAHFCHGATTVTMLASRLSGIPFSFTAHAKDIYLPSLNPGGLLAVKMRRAEFVVTCTKTNKEHLDAVAPGGAKVHALYHGLDTSRFRPGYRAASDKPLILSVGRFVEKKGFDLLVRACAMLRDRGRVFECAIVGGHGDAYEGIEALVRDLKLEGRVRLAPAVTQEELRGIYERAAMFVLPCRVAGNGDRDGIPNVLAEAMAMELPVISTNVSGIPEIVESGTNGLLVDPGEAGLLAAAIEPVLDSPEYGRLLGMAARRTILDVFDSQRNTTVLRDLFTGWLARKEVRTRKVGDVLPWPVST